MFNYYENVIWEIDGALFACALALSAFIIIYSALKDILWRKRNQRLAELKKSFQHLAEAGKNSIKDGCISLTGRVRPEEFLSITHDINSIIPRKFESQLRQCFISYNKLSDIERLAEKSGNKWKRIQAIIMLGYTKSESALNILKASLLNKDEDISYFSLLALGEMKDESSARALFDFLQKKIYSGYKIISLLESFPASVAEVAIEYTKSDDPFVRFWALRLLSKLKLRGGLNTIIELTKDSVPNVRAAACDCLAEIGGQEAAAGLRQCLYDNFWFVRMHAVRGMGKVLGKGSVREVSALIQDGNWLVRDAVKKVFEDNIEESLVVIEKIFSGNDDNAKADCTEVLEFSGYIDTMLKELLAKEPHTRTLVLLKGMVGARAHLGLEWSIKKFSSQERAHIISDIAQIDPLLSEHIDKKIKDIIKEP
ncbi:MAG: HEAT repeat domain-containing protein [Candidatus Omnitrophica bacterium]|nr:HEAT repeat domain-containing protein [Candidatus Omnitrophota bacterium]MDD5237339.1 HEAT repeat domain-containing protein [Candidatus Omnitrophota bacterium]